MNSELRKQKNALKAELFRIKTKIDELHDSRRSLEVQLKALNKMNMSPRTLSQKPPVPKAKKKI